MSCAASLPPEVRTSTPVGLPPAAVRDARRFEVTGAAPTTVEAVNRG